MEFEFELKFLLGSKKTAVAALFGTFIILCFCTQLLGHSTEHIAHLHYQLSHGLGPSYVSQASDPLQASGPFLLGHHPRMKLFKHPSY